MRTALALGTFDGVHIGHRAVLSLPQDFYKIAVVFKKTPKAEISGNSEALMSFDDKCQSIKSLGIDAVFPLIFEAVKDMSAENFLDFLKEKFNPALISCGFNYRFGKGAAGDTNTLKAFCDKNGIILRCADPVFTEGKVVSSTYIRSLLKNGEIEKATKLLSRPFSYTAKVISGDRRGRTLGFPTINQKYPEELVKLKFGVYLVTVKYGDKEYEGIANIGIRPTFESEYIISETFINNFDGNLYEKNITIVPLKFLREEQKFNSIEELKNQIAIDLQALN